MGPRKLPNWPAYTKEVRATMVFNNECKAVNDPNGSERHLWATIAGMPDDIAARHVELLTDVVRPQVTHLGLS